MPPEAKKTKRDSSGNTSMNEDNVIVSKAELERLHKSEQKLKGLQALVIENIVRAENIVHLRPKRHTIRMAVQDARNKLASNDYFYSDPREMLGFQWKLSAHVTREEPGWLGLFLHVYPPDHHKDAFKFEVDYSFHLVNIFPSRDITKMERFGKFERCTSNGWGFPRFLELNTLLDPANGFIQFDGSILVEANFTIESATIGHLLTNDE